MSSHSLTQSYPQTEQPPLIIERFLRDRDGVWQQIRQGYDLNRLLRQMLLSSSISLALYGVVLGFSNSALQAASSAVKLPVLFFLTLAICLPTLYLFNLLFRGQLSARQVLALVLATITVTSGLTLSFAPISLFFLLTARSYEFFKLLNVAILTLTGFVGLRFLLDGMRHMNLHSGEEPVNAPGAEGETQPATRRGASMTLLRIWIVIFAFVGTQMAWTLRPFFGAPELPFELFRSIEGNFYMNVVEELGELLR